MSFDEEKAVQRFNIKAILRHENGMFLVQLDNTPFDYDTLMYWQQDVQEHVQGFNVEANNCVSIKWKNSWIDDDDPDIPNNVKASFNQRNDVNDAEHVINDVNDNVNDNGIDQEPLNEQIEIDDDDDFLKNLYNNVENEDDDSKMQILNNDNECSNDNGKCEKISTNNRQNNDSTNTNAGINDFMKRFTKESDKKKKKKNKTVRCELCLQSIRKSQWKTHKKQCKLKVLMFKNVFKAIIDLLKKYKKLCIYFFSCV